ncbi:MAG: tetratricopeptide repeat protein, partial [Chloroflexia bacterium]
TPSSLVPRPSSAEGFDVLDGVASLVNKSLVRQEQSTPRSDPIDASNPSSIVHRPSSAAGPEPRFTMLETIREFGREQLQALEPGAGQEFYRQHALYYTTLADQGREGVQGPQQEMWLDRFEAEHDNLQSAMRWALEHDVAQTALCLGAAFWIFRGFRVQHNEGYEELKQALRLPGAEARNRARALALMGASLMSGYPGDRPTTRAYIEESISILRELGPEHRRDLGTALLMRSLGLVHSGEQEAARAAADEGILLLRQVGDKWGLALGLFMRGSTASAEGDLAAARSAYDESILLAREVGNIWVLSHVLNALGDISRLEGDYPRAEQAYEESLAVLRRLSAVADIPASLHNLGHVALAQGRPQDARQHFIEALRLQAAHKDRAGIAECLAGLAGVAAAERHPERAAHLLGATEALRETLTIQVWPAEQADYARTLETARAQLGSEPAGQEAWDNAWQEGRALVLGPGGLERAITYALDAPTETATPAAGTYP